MYKFRYSLIRNNTYNTIKGKHKLCISMYTENSQNTGVKVQFRATVYDHQEHKMKSYRGIFINIQTWKMFTKIVFIRKMSRYE